MRRYTYAAWSAIRTQELSILGAKKLNDTLWIGNMRALDDDEYVHLLLCTRVLCVHHAATFLHESAMHQPCCCCFSAR